MDAILERMLADVLVIPFQGELATQLAELTEKYSESAKFNQIEDCILAFICGKENSDLSSFIEKEYYEQYGEHIKLPIAVYNVLSEYVLYVLIIGYNSYTTPTNKMIYSLAVRNMMVQRKNSYERLLSPQFIVPMYKFSDRYREQKNRIEECTEMKIVPTIFESNNFGEMEIKLGEENFSEIKRLAQQAAKLEYQELISKIKMEGINDPFILAYYAACQLAMKPQWKYVDSNPVKTLLDIISIYPESIITLKEIKERLETFPFFEIHIVKSKTSILLDYLSNKETCKDLDGMNFSTDEFTIYLYYELFLEELIKSENE